VHAVVVAGPPASGKSTVGRALAREIGAALLDLDTATAPLVAVLSGVLGVRDLDDPRLGGPTRAARYETLLALAEDSLAVRTPVVLVAPFTAECRDRAAWQAVETRLAVAGGLPTLVWLHLDPDVVVRRLLARGAERDAAKVAEPAAFRRRITGAEPLAPHVTVAADRPVQALVADLVAALALQRAR
jgi:predicted kinase